MLVVIVVISNNIEYKEILKHQQSTEQQMSQIVLSTTKYILSLQFSLQMFGVFFSDNLNL